MSEDNKRFYFNSKKAAIAIFSPLILIFIGFVIQMYTSGSLSDVGVMILIFGVIFSIIFLFPATLSFIFHSTNSKSQIEAYLNPPYRNILTQTAGAAVGGLGLAIIGVLAVVVGYFLSFIVLGWLLMIGGVIVIVLSIVATIFVAIFGGIGSVFYITKMVAIKGFSHPYHSRRPLYEFSVDFDLYESVEKERTSFEEYSTSEEYYEKQCHFCIVSTYYEKVAIEHNQEMMRCVNCGNFESIQTDLNKVEQPSKEIKKNMKELEFDLLPIYPNLNGSYSLRRWMKLVAILIPVSIIFQFILFAVGGEDLYRAHAIDPLFFFLIGGIYTNKIVHKREIKNNTLNSAEYSNAKSTRFFYHLIPDFRLNTPKATRLLAILGYSLMMITAGLTISVGGLILEGQADTAIFSLMSTVIFAPLGALFLGKRLGLNMRRSKKVDELINSYVLKHLNYKSVNR